MRPGAPSLALLALLAVLAGCKDFPALDDTIDPAVAAAPYPALLPFEALVQPPPAADPMPDLDAAAAALRARSEALQAAEP